MCLLTPSKQYNNYVYTLYVPESGSGDGKLKRFATIEGLTQTALIANCVTACMMRPHLFNLCLLTKVTLAC